MQEKKNVSTNTVSTTDPEEPSPLRWRGEELELTQQDISLVPGKTDQTISNWETGIYEPKMTPREFREFKKLCKVLQWPLRICPKILGQPRMVSPKKWLIQSSDKQ